MRRTFARLQLTFHPLVWEAVERHPGHVEGALEYIRHRAPRLLKQIQGTRDTQCLFERTVRIPSGRATLSCGVHLRLLDVLRIEVRRPTIQTEWGFHFSPEADIGGEAHGLQAVLIDPKLEHSAMLFASLQQLDATYVVESILTGPGVTDFVAVTAESLVNQLSQVRALLDSSLGLVLRRVCSESSSTIPLLPTFNRGTPFSSLSDFSIRHLEGVPRDPCAVVLTMHCFNRSKPARRALEDAFQETEDGLRLLTAPFPILRQAFIGLGSAPYVQVSASGRNSAPLPSIERVQSAFRHGKLTVNARYPTQHFPQS